MTKDSLLEPLYRISCCIPVDHVDEVVAAVQRVVPLGDGHYDSVHWIIDGVRERFRPLAGANPTRGRIGELHEEASSWLVLAIPHDESVLERVLGALRDAHPWEAPSVFVDEAFRSRR